MTTIKKVQVAVLAAVLVGSMLVGCAGKHTDNSRATTAGNTAGDITVSREPETEAPTQAPTQAPTEPPTQAPTEAPTQEHGHFFRRNRLIRRSPDIRNLTAWSMTL